MAIFDSPQNPHHLTNHQKIGTGNYVGSPYGCAKFVANPPMGGLLSKWVKYNENFFIYTFFQELTYRLDPSTDFHALRLKRRGLSQGCAFWGFR